MVLFSVIHILSVLHVHLLYLIYIILQAGIIEGTIVMTLVGIIR